MRLRHKVFFVYEARQLPPISSLTHSSTQSSNLRSLLSNLIPPLRYIYQSNHSNMKVFLNYEDNENKDYHKSLKITLPKSWKKGPASNLLDQFVESYNAKFQDTNPLQASELHLGMREQQEKAYGSMEVAETKMVPMCNDDVVIDTIPDRSDVYICHGPGRTKAEVEAKAKAAEMENEKIRMNTVACTRFGCQKRFPKGGPYPDCTHHKLPPVFHETAKFWSCCPDKKAYGMCPLIMHVILDELYISSLTYPVIASSSINQILKLLFIS
jgi:hypothetical protein